MAEKVIDSRTGIEAVGDDGVALNSDAQQRNWKGVLDSKWFFHLHFSQFGFPVPQTYDMYLPGSGLTVAGKPLGNRAELRALLEELRPDSLVIKPVGGIMGHGS